MKSVTTEKKEEKKYTQLKECGHNQPTTPTNVVWVTGSKDTWTHWVHSHLHLEPSTDQITQDRCKYLLYTGTLFVFLFLFFLILFSWRAEYYVKDHANISRMETPHNRKRTPIDWGENSGVIKFGLKNSKCKNPMKRCLHEKIKPITSCTW